MTAGRIAPELVREVKARVDIAGLVARAVELRRHGRELTGLCPFHNEKSPSFTVVPAKGFFHCFGCGAHGDAVGFVMRHERVGYAEAVARLAGELGLTGPGAAGPAPRAITPAVRPPAPAAPRDDDGERRRLERAVAIWRAAGPGAGSPVEAYLRGRGITLPVPATLRCHPGLDYRVWNEARRAWDVLGRWPAMIAPIQAPDRPPHKGPLIGIHRTWIMPDGSGKAPVEAPKRMLGAAWGGAIRLCPAAEVMAVGEGIETVLSVMQARPGLAGWAAGSLGNLAGAGHPRGRARPHPTRRDNRGRPLLLPVELPDPAHPGFVPPPGVRTLILLADADGDRPIGTALMARACARFRRMGLDVRVAWPRDGMDFNDMLRRAAA